MYTTMCKTAVNICLQVLPDSFKCHPKNKYFINTRPKNEDNFQNSLSISFVKLKGIRHVLKVHLISFIYFFLITCGRRCLSAVKLHVY